MDQWERKERLSARQTALKAAADIIASKEGIEPTKVLEKANDYYAWLMKGYDGQP